MENRNYTIEYRCAMITEIDYNETSEQPQEEKSSAGVYWISTKGQGLIKAIETSQGNFKLQHFKHKADDPYSLSNDNIYFTFQDSRQRLWVATYGGGLNLIETMPDGTLRFIKIGRAHV